MELLYADDIAVIDDTLEECITKLKAWKMDNMENKGLRVNIQKTKFMISGAGLDMLRDASAFPRAVKVELQQTLLAVPSAKCESKRSAVVSRAD